MAMWKGFAYSDVSAEKKTVGKNAEDVEIIEASVEQILRTSPGERCMLPEFGSRLRTLLFEPLDNLTVAKIESEILSAIRIWEDRIVIVEAKVTEKDEDNHKIKAVIAYYLKVDPANMRHMDLSMGV